MTHPPRPLDAVADRRATVPASARPVTDVVAGDVTRPPSPRFGQLTYSSFDDGTGIGGGWQVKESTGGLTDAESESLRYWVDTTFELVTPLPQFPTPEDVAAFPHRLMYTTLGDGRAGFWHTAPAGADGSGRPGNVFAHAVLDRDIASTGNPVRPIDLWRSTDWLTPYGAAEVAGAMLVGGDVPSSAEVVGRSSVVEFLCSPEEWRLGVLGVLLDAVASAMNGGPTVVLGTRSVDTAALWIGAVSHLMSAGSARTLTWSTFDRASAVSVSASRGVHLVAVPTVDIASLTVTDDLVVISEDETPSIGDLGGAPHRTMAGSTVPVTEWSVIAQGVLIDSDTARRALEVQDGIASRMSDVGLHPMWPLAMSVALTDELQDDVGDEAAAVIAQHSPEQLGSRSDLLGPASALIDRTLGTTAADCWRQLSGVRPNRSGGYSVTVELIMAVYVDRTLRDRDWLMQPGGVPFPAPIPREGWAPKRLADQVASSISGLFGRARSGGAPAFDMALEVLREVDFLARAGCIGETSSRTPGEVGDAEISELLLAPDARRGLTIVETAQNAVESAVAPFLLDHTEGPRFVERFGAVDQATAKLLVRPVLVSSGALDRGLIGSRVSEVVLTWMLPRRLLPPPPRVLLESVPGGPDPLAVVAAEVAYRRSSSPRTVGDWAGFNLLVLWRVLEQSSNPSVRPPDLTPVFRAPFDVDVLSRLLDRYDVAIPPRFFVRTMATSPASSSLLELAHRLWSGVPTGRDSRDDGAVALACFRLRSEWTTMATPERQSLQSRYLGDALREALQFGVSSLPADLVHTLAVVSVTRTIDMPDRLQDFDLVKLIVRAAEVDDRGALVAAVAAQVRPGGVRVDHLVQSAVLGTDGGPDSRVPTPTEKFLGTLTREVDDRPVSLLDAVVETLVEKGVYDGPADPDAMEESLSVRVSAVHSRSGDKVLAQYKKFAKKWLDDRGLGAAGLMSRLRRK